jgi:zinc protease
LYEQDDFDMAAAAAQCIIAMGFGDFDPVALDKAVTGKLIKSHPAINIRSQNITASCSRQDLETALQLTYLQFTTPRKDTLLFRKMIDQSLAGLANRYVDPGHVFQDTMNYVMGNYNYRMAPPSEERINKIDLDRVYQIYKERFGDASGFTFVFTGSFDPESIAPLITRYLGALPATHKQEEAKETGIHLPEGIITKKVYKGTENKATVRIVLSGGYQYSPMANLELQALGDILQIKVLEQLREAEGEVYSPKVQVAYNKYPKQRSAVNIAFGCAPANVDHLVMLIGQELAALREQGPKEEDIQKFKAQYAQSLELSLKDNFFWLQYLLNQYENNENVLQVLDISKNLEQMDARQLKAAAQVFLSGQNMITFELLPE